MDVAPLNQKTGYARWMKTQGLPVHTGHGMADLRALEVRPYSLGGAFADDMDTEERAGLAVE